MISLLVLPRISRRTPSNLCWLRLASQQRSHSAALLETPSLCRTQVQHLPSTPSSPCLAALCHRCPHVWHVVDASSSTGMSSAPSRKSRAFRVRASTVPHEHSLCRSSCCQSLSMVHSPSAVSRRSPSRSLVSCIIRRRISLAQRLCAAVTTSAWPAHQAL